MKKIMGFTLVEIMIVVAIIAILAAIAIPQLIASRKESRKQRCMNNLKVIKYAKEQLMLASDLDPVQGKRIFPGDGYSTSRLIPWIKDATAANPVPTCPSGGTVNEDAMGTNPNCSLHGQLQTDSGEGPADNSTITD